MPVDTLLTLFRAQLVHSKITVTRTSLPLAMSPPLGFLFTQLFYFGFETKKKGRKKIEVTNLKSNYKNIVNESYSN